jgi:hypothetical protein
LFNCLCEITALKLNPWTSSTTAVDSICSVGVEF